MRPIRAFMTLFVLQLFLSPSVFSSSQELPVSWPWRAVSIGFPDSDIADLRRYKDRLNINSVRLLLTPRQYAEQKKVDGSRALEEALAWTDKMLDECLKLGLTAIVTIDHFPFDPSDPNKPSSPSFWNSNEELDKVVSVAHILAARYHKRGKELAAYQVIAEPTLVQDGRANNLIPSWGNVLQRSIAEIRKEDKTRWIVVSPAPGALPQAFEQFRAPLDSHLVWCTHMYLPYAFTHQGVMAGMKVGVSYPGFVGIKFWDKDALRQSLEPINAFSQRNPGPIYVGEFSATRWAKGGEDYIRDLVSIFNENGWGWSYFSAGGWPGWNADYDDNYSESDPISRKPHYVGDGSKRWQTLKSIFLLR